MGPPVDTASNLRHTLDSAIDVHELDIHRPAALTARVIKDGAYRQIDHSVSIQVAKGGDRVPKEVGIG